MTMPVDLVLIRHGHSEGNEALHLSKRGDHSKYTADFQARHSVLWRLTEEGSQQAERAGEWLRANMPPFDRHYVSQCVRAVETAERLQLPNARWMVDMYLREREWGQFDCSSIQERAAHIEAFRRRAGDDFYWKPTGGESLADLCLRIDRFMDTMHRENEERRVLVVAHGEVMWGFRIRLERLMQPEYRILSKSARKKIHNCYILHYTRRNPDTGEVAPYLQWARAIDPVDHTLSGTWEEVERPTFTNDQLKLVIEAMERK